MKNLIELLENIKSTPGKVIRAHRRNFLITLKELACATGIAESNLSLIENDKIELGVKRATLIGAALGIEPGFILFPNDSEGLYDKEVRQVKARASKLFALKRRKFETNKVA